MLADQVGGAMQAIMDSLAPAERVAFVLHDVFGYPFDDISALLGRSGAATRKLASRARHKLHASSETTEEKITRDDHEQVVGAFLAGVLRDVHLVDEAFQKAVVKAIEASASVDPDRIRGWLFRIALNEARGLRRVASQQNRLHKSVWESLPPGSQSEPHDGFLQLVSVEEREAVRMAVSRLSDDFREVVMRRIQKGQTFAVIAEEMDKPLGTVLTWMRRALKELRESEELRRLFPDAK